MFDLLIELVGVRVDVGLRVAVSNLPELRCLAQNAIRRELLRNRISTVEAALGQGFAGTRSCNLESTSTYSVSKRRRTSRKELSQRLTVRVL